MEERTSILYEVGCPHDGNGRHEFEPRYSYKQVQGYAMREKIYECDVCIYCGITTKAIEESRRK